MAIRAPDGANNHFLVYNAIWAWCWQPNNHTTKQSGDPRASLLLTTEKAVFCNPVNHLLFHTSAEVDSPPCSPCKSRIWTQTANGDFKKIRHGMRLHNHLIHLPEEVRTQMVVWIVISLQIKQGVFQNIHFWMSFLAISSPFSDNLRAK